MRAAWVIAMKDLRQLVRDRMACFFALVFPLLIAVFFGTIFAGAGSGGSGGHKIGVLLVDEDRTPGSQAFARTLHEAAELDVSDAPDRAGAINLVRTGKTAACIVLPKGFGETREKMFWGGGSSIALAVDPGRTAEAGMLEGVLTKYGFMQMQDSFKHPEKMRDQVRLSLDALTRQETDLQTRAVFEQFYGKLDSFLAAVPEVTERAPKTPNPGEPDSAGPGGWQPIRIEKLDVLRRPEDKSGPPNTWSITFPQGVVWGVMGCALGFSIGLVLERSRGTMIRLRAAPLSQAQILGGKALGCFLATTAVSALVLAVGIGIGVRPRSPVLLVAAVLCVSVCFVGVMMLLSCFGRSERGGNSLGWGIMLVLSMIGGGMIPEFFMPGWLKTIGSISPVRWSIVALEGAIWRSFTPVEMLKPCLILLAMGVGGFIIGARTLGRTEG